LPQKVKLPLLGAIMYFSFSAQALPEPIFSWAVRQARFDRLNASHYIAFSPNNLYIFSRLKYLIMLSDQIRGNHNHLRHLRSTPPFRLAFPRKQIPPARQPCAERSRSIADRFFSRIHEFLQKS